MYVVVFFFIHGLVVQKRIQLLNFRTKRNIIDTQSNFRWHVIFNITGKFFIIYDLHRNSYASLISNT